MPNITTEYIQFSKRITNLGVILVTIVFILCLIAITFFITIPEAIHTIATLFSAYITIMGITIGAYQGNSSLEKWTKAKYQYENLEKSKKEEEEE